MDGATLYVGCDESCRGNKKDNREIIAAAFSIVDSDGDTINETKRCEYRKADSYLNSQGRGWNFTVRSGNFSRHQNQRLTTVLPSLVSHYLDELPDRGENLFYISVSLDGAIHDLHMDGLADELLEMGFWDAKVGCYVKKRVGKRGTILRGYSCPSLVWFADGLASGIFRMRKNGLDLNDHRKYIEPLIDI